MCLILPKTLMVTNLRCMLGVMTKRKVRDPRHKYQQVEFEAKNQEAVMLIKLFVIDGMLLKV